MILLAVVGLDAKRAAGILGKRVGAVRTAAHRGIRKLSASWRESAHTLDPARPGPTPARARRSCRPDPATRRPSPAPPAAHPAAGPPSPRSASRGPCAQAPGAQAVADTLAP
ncbi:hypothetical protein [Streptomyces sp. KL116D]|uniref:hypothetical protein n=1 Tax=Streptomyces sp. KL116D TaxID=3045152 RepID=UPI003555E7BE